MIEAGPPASFAQALDAAISERGVTLAHLHRRLTELATPVSVATLSYWRSGRSVPERQNSLAAVGILEEVLGLGEGGLTGHLQPVRRPGPPIPAVPIEELTGHSSAVRRGLARLDFETAHDELADDATALSIDVDEHGRAHRVSALKRWRALQDGAQRAALVFTTDDPDEAPPVVITRAGIDVGRRYADVDHLLHITELVLERPLDKGETGFGEYEIQLSGLPGRDGSLAYYASRRVAEVLVWVRFHRDRLPRSMEAFDVRDGVETTSAMELRSGRTLHRQAQRYGPGTIGIRWVW